MFGTTLNFETVQRDNIFMCPYKIDSIIIDFFFQDFQGNKNIEDIQIVVIKKKSFTVVFFNAKDKMNTVFACLV